MVVDALTAAPLDTYTCCSSCGTNPGLILRSLRSVPSGRRLAAMTRSPLSRVSAMMVCTEEQSSCCTDTKATANCRMWQSGLAVWRATGHHGMPGVLMHGPHG